MNINNILTLEELYKVAISIPNKEYVFDQMDRRNCFECHAAAVITGLNHTMKGFWAFFLPPSAMPIAIRRRMKTHVDRHFADHMENYIARSQNNTHHLEVNTYWPTARCYRQSKSQTSCVT